MVVRERLVIKRDEAGDIIEDEPTVEKETYILSRPMQAEEFGCYVRGHCCSMWCPTSCAIFLAIALIFHQPY
jgi:hypothetical protein